MPRTRYAESEQTRIAYQVFGDGPRDLVYVPGWISNVELMWEDPVLAGILNRLGTFARVITFDKRGTGMSDPVALSELPTLETRMDDVRAVMDAAGSDKATLFGHSEGGNMCVLFAATYPERTDGLILAMSYAKRIWSEDYPWAPVPESREAHIRATMETWGEPDNLPGYLLGTRADDEVFRNWLARYFRLSASPSAAAHLLRMNTEMDTRAALGLIGVPTLCIYKTEDEDVMADEGRWIASQIPGSRFVEIPGSAHLFFADDPRPFVDEIEEFMTGHRESARPERVLATVLYTDITGSTARATSLGDREWAHLLERHNRIVRDQFAKHRGKEVDNAGDGFLSIFDGPGRAIRAAKAIREAVSPLGLEITAGVHAGEVETLGQTYAGLALHIGARIAALAEPGEILVSRTVKDLVVGSDFTFETRGSHSLKGVAGEWEVYALVS